MTGAPVDPDCAHCVLAKQVAEFINSHPNLEPAEIFGQLLQLASDYAASQFRTPLDQIAALQTGPVLLPRLLASAFRTPTQYRRLQ